MTDIDFKIAMETFAALWPRAGEGLNREQLNVYRMAFGSHTAEQVQAVLRDLATTSDKWPAAPVIRARLNGTRKQGTGKQAGRFDGMRARHPETADWNDEQCDLAEHKWTFEGAAKVYGPGAGWTVEYWRRWQAALLHYGHRDQPLADSKDHAAVIREYEELGGAEEARQIHERKKHQWEAR